MVIDMLLNMVCNCDMRDKDLIISLGGPAKVAALLGFDKKHGTQRVFNWMTRGIPYRIRVENKKIFNRKAA